MSEWISVEDRLPDVDTLVLATGFDYGYQLNKMHYVLAVRFDNYWYSETDFGVEYKYITHWMPLPEPPK